MIPRHQKILFGILLLASLVMGVLLWQLRERAHQTVDCRSGLGADQRSGGCAGGRGDADGGQRQRRFAADPASLPAAARRSRLPRPRRAGQTAGPVCGSRCHAPGSRRREAQSCRSFCCPRRRSEASAPASTAATSGAPPQNQPQTGPQLAVVNLTGSFAANHPSGIATETLTVLSICGTLHANLPRVTQVRFLVDGKQRETLAGHADLTRAYLVGEMRCGGGASVIVLFAPISPNTDDEEVAMSRPVTHHDAH